MEIPVRACQVPQQRPGGPPKLFQPCRTTTQQADKHLSSADKWLWAPHPGRGYVGPTFEPGNNDRVYGSHRVLLETWNGVARSRR
jgi:hypothetical protein